MKKFITALFLLFSLATFACHTTSISLVSGPTPIGGGLYQTTIQACFGQYTAGNWGGTQNFTFILSGATYVSFSPATITNTYKAYSTASCSGPNCFMGTCISVSATATGSITSSTVVTYNTTSSTPAGYPIVPDDNESCTGCPTSFCFNFTFVSNGYPTSISLAGNIEEQQPKVCRSICGFATNYLGGPCNGSFDADMTISFAPLPIELLYFNGINNGYYNLLEWTTATETNNDYFTVERSTDAAEWTEVDRIDAAGNSSTALRYTYRDYGFESNTFNYYRLKQTDVNGEYEYFQIIAVDNHPDKVVISQKVYDINGIEQTGTLNPGMYIFVYSYSNGSVDTKKIIVQ